jgi:hypothetical protein
MPSKAPARGGAKDRAAGESKGGGENAGTVPRSKMACEGLARNENSAVNTGADRKGASTKKTGPHTGGGKGGLRGVPEYDTLEYIAPLPEGSQRPGSAHHSIIFEDAAQDRWPARHSRLI